ncbi:Unknown protein sequence [Pseudomonas syringae pv. maculicola]|nr:Unknown protein sequence [Pseudomonas syringae pv. maculicola]
MVVGAGIQALTFGLSGLAYREQARSHIEFVFDEKHCGRELARDGCLKSAANYNLINTDFNSV